MATKRISVSDLAAMVKRGIDELQGDLRDLRLEISDIRAETNHRVDALEYRHGNRLDRLEDDMRVVKTKVGIR